MKYVCKIPIKWNLSLKSIRNWVKYKIYILEMRTFSFEGGWKDANLYSSNDDPTHGVFFGMARLRRRSTQKTLENGMTVLARLSKVISAWIKLSAEG